jgi:hypothetical protein
MPSLMSDTGDSIAARSVDLRALCAPSGNPAADRCVLDTAAPASRDLTVTGNGGSAPARSVAWPASRHQQRIWPDG